MMALLETLARLLLFHATLFALISIAIDGVPRLLEAIARQRPTTRSWTSITMMIIVGVTLMVGGTALMQTVSPNSQG